MFKSLSFFLFLFFLSPCHPVPAQARAADAGAVLKFQLNKAGFVSVAIDDAKGKRIRNLVGGKWLEAGYQSLPWDGLDDTGQPVPAGNYQWKGLIHQGIQSEFQGAFNSPGNPPWLTSEIGAQYYVRESGRGGWLSDHAAPLCAYSDGEHIYFGAKIAEAGHSIMKLDQNGEKTWGTLWLGLSGANAIFKRNDILYVAGEKGWMRKSLAVFRLNPETHKLMPNPKGSDMPKGEVAFLKVKSEDFSDIKGMVVTDEFIVLSLGDKNRLALFDVETGNHVRDIPLPGAGAIVPSEQDTFLAVSGNNVVRLKLENAASQAVISNSLAEPAGLAVSSQGYILVSDVAEAQQVVKVFSPSGAPLKLIGTPGGRKEGLFDPTAMNKPIALAVDGKDQVWVGENSFLPKRVSVWTMGGELLDSWTGPPAYGGGGALDTENPTRAFYKGMEFTVAPWPQASKLRAILFDPKEHLDLPLSPGHHNGDDGGISYEGIPQSPVYRANKLYLLTDQGYGVKSVFIGEVAGNHLQPRVIFGSLNVLVTAWKERHPDFIASLSADGSQGGTFLWQDSNSDGKAEPDEVEIQPEWRFGAMWAMRSWPTLNLYARSADRKHIIELSPDPAVSKLTFNLKNAKFIPLPEEIKGVTAMSPDLQGNLLINSGAAKEQGDITNMYYSVSPSGEINWTYPNPYPANWHNSQRLKPGDIQHTLNVEGVISLEEGRGDVFQLNGNKGVRFLLTTDGLYVGQLFGDMRTAPSFSSLQEVSRGLRMDTYSLGDECFSGWFGKTSSGTVLQVVGKDSSNIMRVTGLETLQRLPGGQVFLQQVAQKVLEKQEVILPVTPVQIGAIGGGWEDTQKHQRINSEPATSFAIGYKSNNGMTLKVTVDDSSPFANAGEDPKTLFKTGDAVDFRISVATDANTARTAPVPGDMRFIFSTWRGEPVAVRYRFVVPGTKESEKSTFSSPTGVAAVDEVSILEKAKVEIKNTDKGWELTAYLPWEALGLEEAPKRTLLGDVGLIVSDPEGTRAVARQYYFDRGSQVVSDLPSEVRVDPSKWGEIEF